MYAMSFKFAILFSLAAILVPAFLGSLLQLSSSAESQTPTTLAEENRLLREEVMLLQGELTIERILSKCRSPREAMKEITDRNVRLHREVVGLQDALKETQLDISRGGVPDVLPLVDKIQRRVDTLRIARGWTDEWAQGKSYPSILAGVVVLTVFYPQIPPLFPVNS